MAFIVKIMNSQRMGTLVSFIVLVLLCSFFAYAALNICPKCGYENENEVSVCTHCKNAIPGRVKAAGPSGEKSDGDVSSEDFVGAELVVDEVRKGREYFEKKQYEVARLFFRNAMALDALSTPSEDKNRSDKILSYINKSEQAGRVVERKCRRCDGTGKQPVKFQQLGNTSETKGMGKPIKVSSPSGRECERCSGTGVYKSMGTIDEMKFKIGQASSTYNDLQKARKYQPIGNAWVPADLAESITIKQRVLLMRTVVSPCEYCAGFGKIDCRKCKGEGRIECTASGCVKGKVPLEDDDKRIKRMQGDGSKNCPECNGHGTVVCETCKGEGTVLCTRCDGSGERPLCTKCSGQGFAACRKCKGAGTYKGEPCANCGGDGSEMCSSCRGEGRKQ